MRMAPRFLSKQAVIMVHQQQIERFGGASGIRDERLLESALGAAEHCWHYSGDPHRAMEVSEPTRRQRLAEALEEAAMLNPYRAIEDPVAWQHEQRQDRALPGRDHAD